MRTHKKWLRIAVVGLTSQTRSRALSMCYNGTGLLGCLRGVTHLIWQYNSRFTTMFTNMFTTLQLGQRCDGCPHVAHCAALVGYMALLPPKRPGHFLLATMRRLNPAHEFFSRTRPNPTPTLNLSQLFHRQNPAGVSSIVQSTHGTFDNVDAQRRNGWQPIRKQAAVVGRFSNYPAA